jgi:hypothetical protein
MPQNFLAIQKGYLEQVWSRPLEELEIALPARRQGGCFRFQAFGEPCELCPQEIILSGQQLTGPEGILSALYASCVPKVLSRKPFPAVGIHLRKTGFRIKSGMTKSVKSFMKHYMSVKIFDICFIMNL